MNKFIQVVTDNEKTSLLILGKTVLKQKHKNRETFLLKLKIKIINIIFAFNKNKRIELREKLNKDFFENKYLTEIQNIENQYSDYWIFMPLHCIGDLLMFCRNLKAFKASNGGKIVVIVKDKQRQDFVKLFNSVDEAVIMDEKLYFYGLYTREPVYNQNIKKGKVHLISADFITKKN